MNADRTPLFCDAALAERIERVDVQLVTKASEAAHRRRPGGPGFLIPVAGGVASFAEEGSPFNKVAGLGFGGVPDAAALDEIERAFAACDAPVQVELPHLADPAIGACLSERGYRLESFENVLGRAIRRRAGARHAAGDQVRPSGDDEFDAWLAVQADAAAHPDTQGVPWHEEFPREVYLRAERDMAAAGVRRYAALWDGVLAGGGRPAPGRGRRAVHRGGHGTRVPPPRRPGRAARGPARRRRGRGLRRRRHRHPAGVEVPAERAAPGFRPALHPRRAGQTAVTGPGSSTSAIALGWSGCRPAEAGRNAMTPSESPVRIVLVSGSTRAGSTNTAALRTAAALDVAGVVATPWERLVDVPAFVPGDDGPPPPAVAELRTLLAAADAVVFCTPEYAGTLPGSLKNAIDWLVGSGELYRTPVAWINVAAPGRGAGAEATLATVLGYVDADVIGPACVRIPVGHDLVGADGLVRDPDVRGRLAAQLTAVATHVRSAVGRT